VVAKGVSPPSLGLWLLICLFRNKSAAHLAALLVFLVQLSSSHTSRLFGLAPARGHRGRTPPGFLVCVCPPVEFLSYPSISQKAGLHSPEGNNLA
jgi:hypothetical protein